MISYETCSSLARVNNTGKTSPVENFQAWMKNNMAANMATLFSLGGGLQR
jgi:hypothetical protein